MYREFVKFLDDADGSEVFEIDSNGRTNERIEELTETDWEAFLNPFHTP